VVQYRFKLWRLFSLHKQFQAPGLLDFIEEEIAMRKLLITVAALTMTATGAFAFGQDTIDANQSVQAQRIEQGRYSGELTRREYNALKTEQARIAAIERRAQADGYVSRREYSQIHDAQIQAYRHIKSETHDSQVSFWRKWLFNSRY
jgi:hypothetical protein